MKATAIKCPKCGVTPTQTAFMFELIEPALAYRKLEFVLNKDGGIESINAHDLSHDDGDGDRELGCRNCGDRFPIPEGFWDFDIYG